MPLKSPVSCTPPCQATYLLYESASGYALFERITVDEISIEAIQESIMCAQRAAFLAHLFCQSVRGSLNSSPFPTLPPRVPLTGARRRLSPLACSDMDRFGRVVKLKAFSPFTSAVDALEQINAVSEGLLHDALTNFLEQNLSKARPLLPFLLPPPAASLLLRLALTVPPLPPRTRRSSRESPASLSSA